MVITISDDNPVNVKNQQLRKLAKVLFLGDGAVGKSSIVRLISVHDLKKEDQYLEKSPKVTIGLDVQASCFIADEKLYEIIIWDFGGQPQFRFFQKGFMNLSILGILVFDVTRNSTLTHLKEWKLIAEESSKNLKFIVVANKIDSNKRSIATEFGLDFAEEIGAPYIETSTKTLEGINELVKTIQQLIVEIDAKGN